MQSNNHLLYEFHPCAWCDNQQYNLVFSGPDRLEGLPGTFQVVQCTKCGLYRQNPRLAWESAKNYYTDNYVPFNVLVREHKNWLRRMDWRYGFWKHRRAIERYINSGRLLDVGCGTGLFLEEALRSGNWEVSAIEPIESAASYVKNNLGIDVHQALFTNVNFQDEYFDVITMWNVIEHMENPINSLKYAHRLLRLNGILVFSIPNLEGLARKLFGEYWFGWELPRHTFFFPRKLLRKILNNIGYEVIREECIATPRALVALNFEFWSQSWEDRHPWLKMIIAKLLKTMFARALLLPWLVLLDKLKLTTIITVFAKKIR